MPAKKTKRTKTLPVVKKEATSIPTLPKSYIKPLVIVVLVLGALYLLKGLFVVALVNGQPISRLTVVKELEQEQGKAALDWLVTKTLIFQEAGRRHIDVTDIEVNDEVKNLETRLMAQGQTLQKALEAQGMTIENYKERIKISKVIEKIFSKDVTVSEKEISDFLDKNKDSIPEKTDMGKLRETVAQQIKTQKIDQKGQELIKKLKNEAKINYFHSY